MVKLKLRQTFIPPLFDLNIELKTTLGPACSDLMLRFVHSGPVTAGLLHVDRAKFQLFADTVDTGMKKQMISSAITVSFLALIYNCIPS
jgi:hypothetical protein